MMNFDTMDIYKAIMNGQSPDDLAKSFSDALNAALAEQKRRDEEEKAAAEEKKRLEEEKKAAEKAMKTAKLSDAKEMVDVVMNFLEKYYPEIFPKGTDEDVDVEVLVAVMDMAAAETKRLTPVMETFNKKMGGPSIATMSEENFNKLLDLARITNSSKKSPFGAAVDCGKKAETKTSLSDIKFDPLSEFLKKYDLI